MPCVHPCTQQVQFYTTVVCTVVAAGSWSALPLSDYEYCGCVRLIWISWILWISPSTAHSIIVDFDMDFLDLGNHEILVIHIVERFLGFLGLAISVLCTRVTSHAW